MSSLPLLILDTNIFDKSLKKNHVDTFLNLQQSMYSFGLIDPTTYAFNSEITPFLFLEYIGLLIPKIPDPDPSTVKSSSDPFMEVFKYAHNYFSRHSDLSFESICILAKRKAESFSPAGRSIFEMLTKKITSNPKSVEQIHFHTAMNYSYLYNFQKILKTQDVAGIYFESALDIFRAESQSNNLTQTRAIFKIAKFILPMQRERLETEEFEKLSRAIGKIKEFKDTVDLEVVQFLILGLWMNGTKVPVTFITEDSEETLVSRVLIFYEIYGFFVNMLNDNGYPMAKFSIPKPCPGTVYIGKERGKIGKKIELANVLP